MSLSPEALQTSAANNAKRADAYIRQGLGQAFVQGFLLWSKQPPAKRLEKYTHLPTAEEPWGTQPEDLPLILSPEYLDLYREGFLPAPVSRTWALLLTLPEAEVEGKRVNIFHAYQMDMRNLIRGEERKLGSMANWL